MDFRQTQRQIYQILEKTKREEPLRKVFEFFLITIILLNVVVIILESVDLIFDKYSYSFFVFELFVVFVFTVEYILRIWTCTLDKRYRHPFWGRLKFIFTGFVLIDLLAIIPFYLPLFTVANVAGTRVFQVLRLFRLFKMGRYFEHWEGFVRVFQKKKHELKITVYTIIVLLVLSSSVIYFIESSYQPNVFSSIPAAMWWGVSTLTTVGYGDIVPVTTLGKFFGGGVALLGIGLFALPAGILGSGFFDEVLTKKRKFHRCPHCKKKV